MKKYLISGALALIAGCYFTSCVHDDIESQSVVDQKTQNYDTAFKNLYGNIAPGHTWGFDIPSFQESGVIPAASRTAASRAFTRDANPNHKLWAGTYANVPQPLTEAQKNLVRNYFQQNKNPKGISVDYTNFFVQQVYKGHTNLDNANSDCTEQYTAGNGDTVYGSSQMDKLTAGIKEDHINNFNNADYSGGTTVEVWTGEIRNNDPNDKVYQNDQMMLMENSSTECFGFYNSRESGQYNDHYVIITGDDIMEWAKKEGANLSDDSKGANVAGMFFVGFDFECDKVAYNADGTLNVETNRYLVTFCEQGTQGAVQIPNSTRWATIGGADGYYSDWIVRITNGIKKQTDGGNDQGGGGSTTTSYKKTLAKRHVMIDKGRVFCEDLSSVQDVKEDIDFNDVVFDAIIWYDYWVIVEKDDNGNIIPPITEAETDETHQNSLWADISLLATGATEQIKIGDNEVHAKFGQSNVKYMINTVGASTSVNGLYNTDPFTPVNFQVDMSGLGLIPEGYSGSIEDYLKANVTLDNIPIQVYWNTNGAGRAAAVLAAGNVTKDQSGNIIGMTAPHKIKVPFTTKWPAERRNIQEGYTLFKDYVADPTVDPWNSGWNDLFLYQYDWSLLAHRDMDRHTFFYDSEEEIVEGLVQDYYLQDNSGVTVAYKDYFDNVSPGYKLRIYGRIQLPGYGQNSDSFLRICTPWYQQTYIPFKDVDSAEDVIGLLNNGCIELEFTQSTIDAIKAGNGLHLIGKFFYIENVTIDPQ